MKVVVHYAEIALKGKNRAFFENKLVNNIKKVLEREDIALDKIEKQETRIVCSFNDKSDSKKIFKNWETCHKG